MHYLEAEGYYLRHSVAKGLYWNSARSVSADEGLFIPPRIAWSSRAGAFWRLGALAAEQSVRGLAVSGMCFTANGFLSDWCVLQELHQWTYLWQQQAESTKSRRELTENIALKNTGIFRKKSVVFVIFLTNSLSSEVKFFILLDCVCNLSITSVFLLISYCKWGQ